MREILRRYIADGSILETRPIYPPRKVNEASSSSTVSTEPAQEEEGVITSNNTSSFAMDLTTRAQKKEKVFFDLAEMDVDEFGWTTGGDSTIAHKDIIDTGASGEVHEVIPL